MTTRVVLSAGSNIGDSRAHLRTVVDALGDDLRAVSDVHVTPPWGGVEQDDFANITLIADGDRTPREWLEFCWELERAADRVREIRWGPRTLDVDVVSVEADGEPVVSDDEALTLPHPRARDRAFVLVPWLQIDSDAQLWTPDGVRPVADLVAALDPAEVAGVHSTGEQP
ncbi:2-amino-4-hydroxy-6-hydroxymethyldihydropteridine diphosphokinase [Gordonia phthalatica]|uniref:2-amino-4-hydroxy-6-hydroxymethyldihydropteridine diphosphokinase n=1 Tax=Gordonia phthalatica TaxID=1136941 RepID=A0A0N9N585_9ACTN|nr:2-amino-4-hydroxy-6-hydroxymethyldihydropteridine diphosphokinase [Gordonia phthalatica]ALG86001.1 2-amino-4-hydroxy-6-hydroxymethyldihydropteridine pyrophosphokinase [Gordonia phthalatica]